MSESSAASPSANRRDLLRAIACGAAAGVTAGAARASDDPGGADRSDPARGIGSWPAVRLLGGGTLTPQQLRGEAVVLVVWATHCPFCLRHNAHVDALHRASAGRPLQVVTAALDRDPDAVRSYLGRNGWSFPVTLEAEPLRAAFGLRRVIPLTCTFDRSGRLLQRIPGEMAAPDVLGLRRLADG
jgi:thiol-disulfide isomerase/thioredoxin